MPDTETIIIGGGLAGLACAVRLHEAGRSFCLLEASDGFGGRVRSDKVGGFTLDRGFQIYLDAYRAAGELLDLAALDLRAFDSGARVFCEGQWRELKDPFRHPLSALRGAFSPVGNFWDKCLVAKLQLSLLNRSEAAIWDSTDQSTESFLRDFGFSSSMIDDFFRSFYGGIFLERDLETTSRLFQFTFRCFARGQATLPAEGMQAIPDQLVARLPASSLKLETKVESIAENRVDIDGGELSAQHIVVATDASSARDFDTSLTEPKWKGTTCLHFSAPEPPFRGKLIALQGQRRGMINNIALLSEVAPSYAPLGQSLLAVTLLGIHDTADLENLVRREMVDWFGPEVADYECLRVQHLPRSLPLLSPGPSQSIEYSPIMFAGDYCSHASIEGAVSSGLAVADTIISQ
ncbi:MAG: NAD(P)/FAD-dependent oxidoreductase [Verrucomicrobiota bacterium]